MSSSAFINGRLKHFGGGGMVIDDGGALEVVVWCGGGGVVIGDGGAIGIMLSLKNNDGWKEIIKKV